MQIKEMFTGKRNIIRGLKAIGFVSIILALFGMLVVHEYTISECLFIGGIVVVGYCHAKGVRVVR
jgi:hypothetical protein